jgi:hypothetical protein
MSAFGRASRRLKRPTLGAKLSRPQLDQTAAFGFGHLKADGLLSTHNRSFLSALRMPLNGPAVLKGPSQKAIGPDTARLRAFPVALIPNFAKYERHTMALSVSFTNHMGGDIVEPKFTLPFSLKEKWRLTSRVAAGGDQSVLRGARPARYALPMRGWCRAG